MGGEVAGEGLGRAGRGAAGEPDVPFSAPSVQRVVLRCIFVCVRVCVCACACV